MQGSITATPTVPTVMTGTAALPNQESGEIEVTVVMPCLNEARTLPTCITKIQQTFRENGIAGEIVVADNGSTDGSPEIAEQLGARVAHISQKGYGAALIGGIAAARGKYVVMGDADDSYDFSHIPRFLTALNAGNELVMGNRFLGGILPGAMPPLHYYVGNPVLSGIGRLFFRAPCGDFHCGLRGFSRRSIQSLNLRTTGMEFASEMVVKATLQGLRIAEVPTTLSPDGRDRRPHLRSFRDGWRHLRFMLMYSPRWLFLMPGLLLMLLGIVGYALALPAVMISGVTFDVHTLLVASLAVMIGYQAVQFAFFTKIFAITEGLMRPDERLNRLYNVLNLERGLVAGLVMFVSGMGLLGIAVWQWWTVNFGPLDYEKTMRLVIPGVTLSAIGCQTVLSSFFYSILGLARK